MKVFIAQSIDGYIAGPDGSLEHMEGFTDSDFGYDAFIAGVDGIVMGRTTFDAFYEAHGWPYPPELPAMIITHRPLPRGVPAGMRASEDLAAVQAEFPNAYVDGGHVINQFLARGAIDEVHLFTLPILLGGGIRLFPEGGSGVEHWRLLGSRAYPCGTVENHFAIGPDAKKSV